MSYDDLDLNLIKTFLTVYECKSILLASKRMYVSQPAITKSIKRLEEYLGGKLFIRTPKGLIPTTEGEQFNNDCYNALRILDNGIKRFSSFASLDAGNLNIGSSSTIIRKILLPFISQFNKNHPNVVITITDANSEKLQKYVNNRTLDLAILNMPINNESNFMITSLTKTHDCFIASRDYKKDFLTLEDLKHEKLILQKRPSSNRDYFEIMCEKNNIKLNPSFEIGSFGLITDFVNQGLGIAYTIREFIQDDINANRIKEVKTEFVSKPRDISIITSKETTNSFVCNEFIKEIIKYFSENNN